MIMPRIPEGFRQTGFSKYESDQWIVITGEPADDDDTHNCDAMGCGWDHVIQRIEKWPNKEATQ